MNWLTQTQQVPNWWVFASGAIITVGILILIIQKITSESTPPSPRKKDEPEEEEDDGTFPVLAKFRDGSEIRWAKVSSWAWYDSGIVLEGTGDFSTVAYLSFHNLLWAVDERYPMQRLEPKGPLNG